MELFSRVFLFCFYRVFLSCHDSYNFQLELIFRAFLIFYFTSDMSVYIIFKLELFSRLISFAFAASVFIVPGIVSFSIGALFSRVFDFFFTFETKCCCYVYLILLLYLYVNINCSLLLHHCNNRFNYHTLIKNIFLINVFWGCVVLFISIFNATTLIIFK